MIKARQPVSKPKTQPARKPSLPVKRNASVVSNYSSQSCMSDRIIYKRDSQVSRHADSPSPLPTPIRNISILSDKSVKKIKSKLSAGAAEMSRKNEHSLTGFQWLIVMRHCFHVENKKRATTHIKQKTLVNFLCNRMYPDSVWNKILVMPNEKVFSGCDVVSRLEKEGKWKLNLDDIFVFVSRGFDEHPGDQHESAAETARFVEQMKATQSSNPNNKVVYSKCQQKGGTKKPEEKVVSPMNETDLSEFQITDHMALNISPISVIDQTNNNVSFSLDDSSQQSQFSQSGPNRLSDKHYYESTKTMQSGRSAYLDRFQLALNELEVLKQKLRASKLSEQKSALLGFMDQLTAYSLYTNKKHRGEQPKGGLGSKKASLSSLSNFNSSNDFSHFHGIKLQGNENTSRVSHQILKRIFASSEFTDYFQSFQAIKISANPDHISLFWPYFGTNLRILNLSQNSLRSVSFLKEISTDSLEFINLSTNKLTNISDLLAIPKLIEMHLKNNLIDHVSSDKVIAEELKLIDLSNNQIQKEEDLWALRGLKKLSMVNLAGNQIMRGFKSKGLLPKQIILDYPEVYIFSAYTQYKDIAFETKQSTELATTEARLNTDLRKKA